jgi:RND family efflux transporter MFP subunit
VVAAILVGAGVVIGWAGATRLAAADPATLTGEVTTVPVARRDLGATVLATGVIRPKVGAQVAVGSRVSGVLRGLHVTAGDEVEEGQLLAELDPVEFEAQVARAEAVVAVAAADLRWAEDTFERTRRLAGVSAATEAELAVARRQFETARARQAEAGAALAAARVQLDFTTIRAPIGGVVGDISTQEGETVAASFAAPTFLTIVDLSRLEVWAYVDETDIGRVTPGQRARFTVDAYPDTEFEGRITAIRPTAEIVENVVNYITLIEIEQRPDRTLRPEMTATVNIELEGREAVLSIPNGALRRDAGGAWVLVGTAAGLERRAIEPGFRGSRYTEVLSGLREGASVVVGTAQPCAALPDGEAP